MPVFCSTHYLTLYLLAKTAKGLIITPKTISDDVDLYPNGTAADLNLGEYDKPWLLYIDSSIEKSLSECWKHNKIKTQIKSMWNCVFSHQPSYQIMQKLLNDICPSSHNIHRRNCPYISLQINASVIGVIGQIAMRYEKCHHINISIKCSFFRNYEDCVTYTFRVHVSLRVNITLLKLDLMPPERVRVVLVADCFKIGPHPTDVQNNF